MVQIVFNKEITTNIEEIFIYVPDNNTIEILNSDLTRTVENNDLFMWRRMSSKYYKKICQIVRGGA